MYNVVSTGSWNSLWEIDERQMTIKRASETKNKTRDVALEARALFTKAKTVSWDVAFHAPRRLRPGFPMYHGKQ